MCVVVVVVVVVVVFFWGGGGLCKKKNMAENASYHNPMRMYVDTMIDHTCKPAGLIWSCPLHSMQHVSVLYI